MATKFNTTNGAPTTPLIQYGRARIVGNRSTEVADQINFPKNFKSETVPVVICNYIGYTTKSSSWTDSPIGAWAGVSVAATEISDSGFKPRMRRFDGATLDDAYYVNWIAIGEA